LQKVVVYDWLPSWLGTYEDGSVFNLPTYNGNSFKLSYLTVSQYIHIKSISINLMNLNDNFKVN